MEEISIETFLKKKKKKRREFGRNYYKILKSNKCLLSVRDRKNDT